jgi:hypothetical protein
MKETANDERDSMSDKKDRIKDERQHGRLGRTWKDTT